MTDIELKKRIIELVDERNATGVAIERAISGRLPLTEHPLAERFRMIAGLSATRNALEVQVDNLEQQRDELLEALEEVTEYAEMAMEQANKAGAEWEIGYALYEAKMAIAKAKGGSVNHFPDVAKMVTDGWQLVPIEPTEEMVNSGHAAWSDGEDDFQSFAMAYGAMLAAAPKPEGGAA